MHILIGTAFLSTIVAANWLVATFGIVPIGFGLMAPAGVFTIGLAFTLRDLLQELVGWRWVMAFVVAGIALSVVVATPELALASGAAFGLSETLDLAVYTPLRERRWWTAVVASNVVGTVADSVVFLWLAFGSLAFLNGQVVGKLYMTALALPFLYLARKRIATG